MTSLSPPLLRGLSAFGVATFCQQAIRWTATVLLLRSFGPQAYGLATIAVLVSGFLGALQTFQLGLSMVRHPDLKPVHVGSAVVFSLLTGLAMAALGMLAAPALARAYGQPDVLHLALLAALAPLLAALGTVPLALLQRRARFWRIACAETLGILAGAAAAVLLARRGAGPWAILSLDLVAVACTTLLLWVLCGGIPWARPEAAATRELMRFGKPMTLSGVLEYLRGNLDYMLVGRALGSGALGLYAFAFKLATFPQEKAGVLMSRTLVPLLAGADGDIPELRRRMRQMMSWTALVLSPLLAGLALLAPDLVSLLWGERWLAAVTPLRILCGAGWLYTFSNPCSILLIVLGRGDLCLKIQYLNIPAVLGFLLCGIRGGVEGVCWAVLAYAVLGQAWVQSLTNPLVGLGWRTLFKDLSKPLLCTAAMAGWVLLLKARLPSDLPAWERLPLLILSAGIVYALPFLARPAGLRAMPYSGASA